MRCCRRRARCSRAVDVQGHLHATLKNQFGSMRSFQEPTTSSKHGQPLVTPGKHFLLQPTMTSRPRSKSRSVTYLASSTQDSRDQLITPTISTFMHTCQTTTNPLNKFLRAITSMRRQAKHATTPPALSNSYACTRFHHIEPSILLLWAYAVMFALSAEQF